MMTRGDSEIKIESYLTYLDKEMTIMGILSAFCVAALALLIDLWSGKGSARVNQLISAGRISLPLAAAMLLLAGLSFYRQRSLLAWYYGQMALENSGYETHQRLREWLRDADGWDTWINYQRGFWLLVGSACEFGTAGLAGVLHHGYSRETIGRLDLWCGIFVALAVLSAVLTQKLILERWRQEQNPYAEFRKAAISIFVRR